MGVNIGDRLRQGRLARAGPRASAVTAALLGAAAAAESAGRAVISGWNLSNVLVFSSLGLAGTLPLTLMPPAAAAAVISAVTVLALTGFHTLTVAALGATLIAFYRLGQTSPQHDGALILTPAAVVVFLALALFGHPERDAGILTVMLASLAPAAAWAGSTRRALADSERHGAAQEAILGRLMEHTARGERTRIARELHDVVAHHISVVVVQAETARLTTPGLPAAGAQRLSEIGDGARAALTEMRQLLGVLREDSAIDDRTIADRAIADRAIADRAIADRAIEDRAIEDRAIADGGIEGSVIGVAGDRQPQPGLRQLNELLHAVQNTNRAGTRLIMQGRPATLDAGIELAAFRIVQEALTNARRHAPGAAVDVELVYTRESLLLRIRDNGPGPPSPNSAGLGLLGMRERAAAVGGRLSAGAASNGGFMIEASLPVRLSSANS